ncbi:MAG: class I SAM-dependent methyltransferase [Oscillospiraceae bacterium]|nr:class I SAM-dependent methyltransferase [Oscillospiraceae bacterium]
MSVSTANPRNIRPLALRPRLLAVAGFVRPDDRVLDIGTDHARLPVYLTERGLCASVTATERAEGPYRRAERTIRVHRLEGRIPLLLCDGGENLDPSCYDTVAITGMGADTIADILRKSPWLSEKRLILQPQTRVIGFAELTGLTPSARMTVAEGRRSYTIYLMGGDAG